MMKIKSIIFGAIVFVGVAVLMLSGRNAVAETSMSWQERQKKIQNDNFDRNTIPIVFYGRVEDLDGNPVPDAEVTMRLTWLPPTPMLKDQTLIRTATDQAGRFKIEATGYQLYLVGIVKEGYQYHFKYNGANRGIRFIKGEKKPEFGQFAAQPMVYKVRKKGVPTLLLTGQASFQLRPGENSKWVVDLIGNRWSEPEYIRYKKMIFDDWHGDLQVSLEKEGEVYRLIFKTLDDDAGIVMGKLEQYEAPEKGYLSELVLPINENESTTQRWLFIQGRGRQYYSMLQVETHPSAKWVNVRIGYGTNPNGSRNLEFSPELESAYLKEKYGRNRE